MSKTEKTAIIVLAAGYGTRMKSETPKVLHHLAGRPLIEHVIHTGLTLNPEHMITVLGPHTTSIRPQIEHLSDIVIQQEALGTGDAVKPALPLLKNFNGHVVILYGDTPLLRQETLEHMLAKLADHHICVLGFEPNDPGAYGRLITQDNQLTAIVEFKEANDTEKAIRLCNSGVIVLRKEILDNYIPQLSNKNAKGEYYLTDLIGLATKAGLTASYHTTCESEVLGINNRKELAAAEAIFQNRLRERALLNGTTMIDPSSVFLSYDTQLGADVTIDPHVFFSTGVTIKDNVHIKSYSHLEQCTIESSCTIGPFARIRPGSEIHSGAKVGNFVEIKNATLHTGVKVGHLSYIGDSEVGSETNIGAGTITCNYDGVNKHKTVIGSRSFIGSNTALVAPITIGDNAFIAAGSTITKSVSAESLALTRTSQKEIKNWKKRK